MRYCRFVIVLMALGCLSLSCARHTVYQGWADQLREMPSRGSRIDDVSMLLGTPPNRCEPVDNQKPYAGMLIDSRREDAAVVRAVIMNGPSYQAGLRVGDIINNVGGEPVVTGKQALEALRAKGRVGEPLEVVTSRGTLSIVPTIPKTEQCYWEVQAGQVARSGSGSYFNRYGGGSSSGSAAYERFFRASCRIMDGVVAGCTANWQH